MTEPLEEPTATATTTPLRDAWKQDPPRRALNYGTRDTKRKKRLPAGFEFKMRDGSQYAIAKDGGFRAFRAPKMTKKQRNKLRRIERSQ